ncbi:hypothetical protein B0T16DRAFT_444849 [Cercophora newfieldiana]|uniref:Secreted protein n=1 Tax=Cercophora newfieldiana TaxID=92897 RepID=A0AA40CRT6_9PEZI|nr:hypothetical protein B0T16DRAFT_444849 [Cercophora newfieldiana]
MLLLLKLAILLSSFHILVAYAIARTITMSTASPFPTPTHPHAVTPKPRVKPKKGERKERKITNSNGMIQVCNGNDYDVVLRWEVITDYVKPIALECCAENAVKYPGVSGQHFSNQGWNVIAYGNCKHDPLADHPAMGPASDPWGPNGECVGLRE